ncbi:MAG: DNA primase family protein [Candidatus Heimdallarchaeaceae archaeon]
MQKKKEIKIKKKDARKYVAKHMLNGAKYNEETGEIEIGSREEYEKALKQKDSESDEEKEKLEKVITTYYNKKDLAKQLLEIQPFYFDDAKNWWMWDRKELYWKLVDETDIMNLVNSLSTANTVNAKEKNEILEALKQAARLNKPKGVKPTWIQFKDTIFDIENGKEFKSTPKYFVTNPVPYALHKKKYVATPTIDKIFKEWVGENYVQTLYEIIAYCMLPDYPIHRLFCFVGSGMNGKTCFLRLLTKFIGQKNVTATELDTLLTSRFEITRLHKKLVCIMGETNFSELNKTSIIKKLTGQDIIGFEYKNKNPFEDKNYAKIIIATNNLPITTDKTLGFYRRWCIIDFPNEFSENKDILKDIPEEEYRCLAVKLCGILHDLLKKRKFHNEGNLYDRMKKYEDKSNPFEKFWKENVEEDYDSFIWKHEFRDRLSDWCREHRFRQLSDVTIAREMKERGIEFGRKQAEWYNNENKRPIWRVWLGIKWKK